MSNRGLAVSSLGLVTSMSWAYDFLGYPKYKQGCSCSHTCWLCAMNLHVWLVFQALRGPRVPDTLGMSVVYYIKISSERGLGSRVQGLVREYGPKP